MVMRNKAGISAIVATVLIILITVAAVSIIWAVVIPMIQSGVDVSDFENRASIVVSEGYTVYSQSAGTLEVQVKNEGDFEIFKVDIIVSSEGTSKTYTKAEILTVNQKKVFTVSDLDDDLILGDRVAVRAIPYFSVNGAEEVGGASGDVVVRSESVAVECTKNVNCDDENECTIDDVRICSGGVLGACEGAISEYDYCEGGLGICDEFGECIPVAGEGILFGGSLYSSTEEGSHFDSLDEMSSGFIRFEGNDFYSMSVYDDCFVATIGDETESWNGFDYYVDVVDSGEILDDLYDWDNCEGLSCHKFHNGELFYIYNTLENCTASID